MKNFVYKHVLALSILWTSIIFVLCATPGQYIPSADWLELLSFDKFVHATMFFVLGSLALISVLKHKKSTAAVFLGVLACISYGALLEIMQATCFSNRSADWKDMVANTFGCLLAFSLLKSWRRFVERSRC